MLAEPLVSFSDLNRARALLTGRGQVEDSDATLREVAALYAEIDFWKAVAGRHEKAAKVASQELTIERHNRAADAHAYQSHCKANVEEISQLKLRLRELKARHEQPWWRKILRRVK